MELPRLLAGSRLLTLTGSAGVGRLASRCGWLVRWSAISDGVWFVDLAALTSAELVAPTIASALGMRPSASRSARDVLLDSLRHRTTLIVLDNCEHLIDACASMAEALLRCAPGLRIVASSRESLGLPGEVVYRVPSLSVPGELQQPEDVRSDAIRLFAERAAAIAPDFAVDVANAATIARICRRLDGIPLAIELAAARVRVLDPAADRIPIGGPIPPVTGGARTAVPRQRHSRLPSNGAISCFRMPSESC